MKCEKCSADNESVSFISISFTDKPHFVGHFCEKCQAQELGEDYKMLQKIINDWGEASDG